MAGHDHDGKIEFHLVEPLLQFHPIHVRHLDIGDDTARLQGAGDLEKPNGRRKRGDFIAGRFELEAQGVTNGIVVVDDVNAYLGFIQKFPST